MWNVFKGALMVLTRKRELFVWSLAFPIILSTMFMFMFSNLDSATAFDPVPTAVVADAAFEDSAFADVVDELGEPGDDQLLDVRAFATADEARDALSSGEVQGVLSVDDNGDPLLFVTPDSGGLGVEQIGRTILNTVVNTYVRDADLVAASRTRSRTATPPCRFRSRMPSPCSRCATTTRCWAWPRCSAARWACWPSARRSRISRRWARGAPWVPRAAARRSRRRWRPAG